MTAAAVETLSEDNVSLSEAGAVFRGCRGKALPVDPFKRSDPELRFEDCLPTLEWLPLGMAGQRMKNLCS